MPEDDPSPALPPDPALLNRQPKCFKPVFRIVIWGTVLFMLLAFLPVFFGFYRSRDLTIGHRATAQNNAGQIYYALISFDEDYGCFPNEETATLVHQKYPTEIDLSGSSSNALLRQLFVSENEYSESIYYVRVPGAKKPDGNMSRGHLLEKGEVGYAYISGLSTADDSSSPLLLTPLIPGTTKLDPEPFNGKAVVLQIDKSVVVYEIQSDGHIYRDGIDLLSPKHPVWKGKAPDIRYPEL